MFVDFKEYEEMHEKFQSWEEIEIDKERLL